MDANTIGNIQSNVRHAMAECKGILAEVEAEDVDSSAVWQAYRAAASRLTYVATLLEEGGYPAPS